MHPTLHDDLLKLSERLLTYADSVFYEYPGVAEKLRQEADDLQTLTKYWVKAATGEMAVYAPNETFILIGATEPVEVK